jgi:predicted enzyme related to lactoylglutathione lyase
MGKASHGTRAKAKIRSMLNIQCVTIDCDNPVALADFWGKVLNWKVVHESDFESYIEKPLSETNSDGYPDLLFLKTPDKRVVKNRLHLDLRPADQAAEVARLETLGAKRIEIGQSEEPATTWVVMADPEGNEFCVLRALP